MSVGEVGFRVCLLMEFRKVKYILSWLRGCGLGKVEGV